MQCEYLTPGLCNLTNLHDKVYDIREHLKKRQKIPDFENLKGQEIDLKKKKVPIDSDDRETVFRSNFTNRNKKFLNFT